MKKVLIFVVVLSLPVFGFLGCTPTIQEFDPIISEIRSNLYVGNIGGIKADAITGSREEPFEIDGKSSARQSFTVITIYPSEANTKTTYAYELSIGGTTYSGEMLKHPFNNTYSAEVAELSEQDEIAVTLKHDGKTSTATLSSIITDGYIDADKALEIALKKLAASIRNFKNSGISYEVYIRLLENPVSSSGGYHWYVAFVGENDVTYAILIDPITLEIVAIRE